MPPATVPPATVPPATVPPATVPPPVFEITITVQEDLGTQQLEARELGLEYHDFYRIDRMVVEDPAYDHLEYYEQRVTAYLEDHPEVRAHFLGSGSGSTSPEDGAWSEDYLDAVDERAKRIEDYEEALANVEAAEVLLEKATSEQEKHDALAVYASAEKQAGALVEQALSHGSAEFSDIKNSGAVEDPCEDGDVITAPPVDIDDDTTAGIPPTVMIADDPILEVEETVDEIVVTPEAAEQLVAACDVTAGTLEVQSGDGGWQMVTPGESEVVPLGTEVETLQVRVIPVDPSQNSVTQVIEIDRVALMNLLTPDELTKLLAQRQTDNGGLPWWPFFVVGGLLLIIIVLLKPRKKPDLVIVFDLLGDYDQWKRVFDADAVERRKFSNRMDVGLLDGNQVAILAYGVDVKAMRAFMGTEEFQERTKEFHSEPQIYEMQKAGRTKKPDLVIVFDLLGDYDQWKRVFDADAVERRKFSNRMDVGLLDGNQVAILAYGVDVKAMRAFMGTEEFQERTKEFHSEPQVYEISKFD